jgi:glutaredoxin
MGTHEVTLYTRVGCHLCNVAKAVLEDVRRELFFELTIVDVDSDPELTERYGDDVPVVTVDRQEAFKLRVNAEALRAHLVSRV